MYVCMYVCMYVYVPSEPAPDSEGAVVNAKVKHVHACINIHIHR